jgi:hydroxylaminobenzene mutase
MLLAIGMATGLWSGMALAGIVVVPIPRLALAAHLNCLLGCFWLLGFAFTLPMLSYGEEGKKRLAKAMLVVTYGNWFITLVASALGVRGLVFMGEVRNDVIAALLLIFVVGPGLATSFAWAWGFRKTRAQLSRRITLESLPPICRDFARPRCSSLRISSLRKCGERRFGDHRKGGRPEGFWCFGREPPQRRPKDYRVEVDEQADG